MGKLRGIAIAAALISISSIAATNASAATEVGSTCTASTATTGASIVQTAQAGGSPLPLAVPSAGVITKWKISLVPGPYALPEQLKVYRRTASPKQFQVVGESAFATVLSGPNSFDTRVPVEAGDLIGLFGGASEIGTLFCETGAAGDNIAALGGSSPVGSTATVTAEANELAGAVSAVVEPDADKDGYGDETQDKCVLSALVQIACPPLGLEAVAQAGKSTVTVLVATSIEAPIAVSGTVKLAGGSKRARSSAQAKLKVVTKTVAPGKIGSFKLKFTEPLKSELATLPKGKSLKLKVKAEGKNAAGVATSDKLTVKLKGQA
jgi:hypothetical protein